MPDRLRDIVIISLGDGNPTTWGSPGGQLSGLTYDPENHLTSPGTAYSAGYYHDGMRAWETDDSLAGGKRYFLYADPYSNTTPLMEFDGSGVCQAVNLSGPDGWRSRYYPGSVYATGTSNPPNTYPSMELYTYDPSGNLAQHQTSAGNDFPYNWPVDDTLVYQPFGTVAGELAPYTGVSGFGGQWGYYSDAATGLVLCGHRYYQPSGARWLNRDPIGYAGGINLYAFCGNDPVNRSDPSGDDPLNPFHHSDPQFMGGARNQPLTRMTLAEH